MRVSSLPRRVIQPELFSVSTSANAVWFGKSEPKPVHPPIADRVDQVKPSMIRAVSRVAAHYPKVINLGQGTPADDPPETLIQKAAMAMHQGHNQYSNVWGDPEFRQAIADKYTKKLGYALDPNKHITVTCGATEAAYVALGAVVNPGDRVLVFEPHYDNYIPAIRLHGGIPVFVPLQPPIAQTPTWQLDLPALQKAARQKGVKVILLNNPNNPTGKVFSRKELQAIAAVCKTNNLLAITDDIYEHLLYEGRQQTYLATFPGMRQRTVMISGMSKAYDATGWRVGFVIAPEPWTKAIRRLHDFVTLCAPTPFQRAGIQAMQMPEDYYTQTYLPKYTRRREILTQGLRQAGFQPYPVEGAYYVLADATELCKKLGIRGKDRDIRLVEFMIKTLGVAAIPGSNFFTQNPPKDKVLIRFSFCRKDADLQKAVQRLAVLANPQGQPWGIQCPAVLSISHFASPGIRQMLAR